MIAYHRTLRQSDTETENKVRSDFIRYINTKTKWNSSNQSLQYRIWFLLFTSHFLSQLIASRLYKWAPRACWPIFLACGSLFYFYHGSIPRKLFLWVELPRFIQGDIQIIVHVMCTAQNLVPETCFMLIIEKKRALHGKTLVTEPQKDRTFFTLNYPFSSGKYWKV
jgi:hypothetical protein